MQKTTNTKDIKNNPTEYELKAQLISDGDLVLIGLKQQSLRDVLITLGNGYLGSDSQIKPSSNPLNQAQKVLGIGQNIKIEKTVTINKTAEELYQYWHNFENLPTFMKHLKSVKVLDNKRSHWVANAPLNTSVEWDAQTIIDDPNHLIAWASVEGSDIEHSGFVRFKPATGGRGTAMKVVIEYNPPGGMIGQAIALLFGESPEQQVGDELRHFKQLMEAGEIATNRVQN